MSTKTLALTLSAFIAGCILTASLFMTRPAKAGNDDCRLTDMPFNSVSHALGSKDLPIKYVIPRCLLISGYKIMAVDVESDQRIQVHYRKGY